MSSGSVLGLFFKNQVRIGSVFGHLWSVFTFGSTEPPIQAREGLPFITRAKPKGWKADLPKCLANDPSFDFCFVLMASLYQIAYQKSVSYLS